MPVLSEVGRCVIPKKIDPAVKARALRLVKKYRGRYSSLTAACQAVARQERIGVGTLRRWVRQAEVDEGSREGAPAGSWNRSAS